MPELNLVATPAPAAAPAAASASPSADAASGGAQDKSSAGPFAAVLVQQIVKQAATEKSVAKPDVQLAAEPTKDTASPEDLAALMPMLLGMVASAAAGAADPATAAAAGKATQSGDDGKGQDAPLAAATSLLPVATDTGQAKDSLPKGTATPTPALPAAAPNTATPSAILAAAPAAEERPNTADDKSKPQNGFDTLLSAARDARDVVAAAQTHAATSPAPAMPVAHVDTPVGTHGWDGAVADKVVWMAGQQQSKAELVLNPPQMGRIEVSLTVSGDQANAVFVSANPEVRQALENALPHLREVLLDAGINLGQAQVGAQSSGQSASGGENRDNSFRGQAAGRDLAVAGDLSVGDRNPWLRTGRGLVDTFA